MGITVGKSYDLSAAEFFNATQILTPVQKQAVNELVTDLKIYNLWNKMKAVYPFVGQAGVSSSFSYNLKDINAFRGVFTSGWTFASTGITGDGASAYMNTGWDTNNNASYNNFSIGYYSGTNLANGGIFGSGNPGINSYVHVYPRTAANLYYVYINEGTGYGDGSTDSRGFFQNSINGTAVVGQVRNSPYSTTLTPVNGNTFDIYFGASNVNGSAAGFDSREIRFAYLGDTLTATDISNYYTAVQRFQTTLGRQV